MKRYENHLSVATILTYGVGGAMTAAAIAALLLFCGCAGPLEGSGGGACVVNVARAVAAAAEPQSANTKADAPAPHRTKSADTPTYSTTPMVRKWDCRVGSRLDHRDDLLRLLKLWGVEHDVDPAWLGSRSTREMIALHSDYRENAVQWNCVARTDSDQPASASAATAVIRQPRGEVLDFSATWCGPCQRMAPIVSKLERAGYPIRKVDVDSNRALARKYGISSIPAFVLVVDGEEVTRVTGAIPERRLVGMLSQIPTDPLATSHTVAAIAPATPLGHFEMRKTRNRRGSSMKRVWVPDDTEANASYSRGTPSITGAPLQPPPQVQGDRWRAVNNHNNSRHSFMQVWGSH